MKARTPAHIKAKRGEVAERVLVSGDPERVKQLSTFLGSAKLVNSNRGYLIYTGEYSGKRVSVACHGTGAPSTAIVVEELVMLGAQSIIRLGTAGGLLREMEYGDVLIANGSFSSIGGTIGAYMKWIPPPTVPSPELFDALVRASRKSKSKVYIGPVFSGDAFYGDGDPGELARMGYFGAEMESSTLFAISAIRGFRSAALFMLSNNILRNDRLLDAEKLRGHLENASTIAFSALTA
jgi:5'-methylthioadenosine phosphorylase